MGGTSEEYEISLASGQLVLASLDSKKYNTIPVKISKEGKWLIGTGKKPLEAENALSKLKKVYDIHAAFIALHGSYGEDGTLQGFLELSKVPYTGSGILASALAMDKNRSSKLFSTQGIKVPKYITASKKEWRKNRKEIISQVKKEIGVPCVVKPSCNGSSVGVSIVKDFSNFAKALKNAFTCGETVLCQKYISGTEVTCGVLDEGGNKKPLALPPTQIVPKTAKFFDYKAKYSPGASEEITPPKMPKGVIKRIQETALRVHEIIGCSGLSRTDMIVCGKEIYVLETNTIPGMTKTSLYPQAAAAAGILFPILLDKLIRSALTRKWAGVQLTYR